MKQSEKLKELNKKILDHKEEEEERLVKYLSEKYKIPAIKISDITVDVGALQLVSEEKSREAQMAVYKRIKKTLSIAVNDINDLNLKQILKELEGRGFENSLSLASKKTINSMWEYYKDVVATSASVPGTLTITNEELEEAREIVHNINDAKEFFKKLDDLPETRKLSKNIEYIVSMAIILNASDIHMEPSNQGGEIRYRLDGVLVPITSFDNEGFKKLLTRMKLISSMKITSKSAQDGSFVIRMKDKTVTVRSSVIPEDKGGSFVIRILDPDNIIHSLDSLGLHPAILNLFQKSIKQPDGMILTTGPTGSGKTTTLYSFLNAINSSDEKIITLEDPIEYRLKGIVQTQISKNYSFSSGLRAILRQDPDVLLVGEIRDDEVAAIAIQAALTGHLVFSTLHTNDALGSLARLAQFNVDPGSFSRAITLVIAQRLVRILCPQCSEKHELTSEQKIEIQKRIEMFPESYKGTYTLENIKKPSERSETCEFCIKGYKGRLGIFEAFEVTDEVEDTYIKISGTAALKEAVKKQKLPFIDDDGLWKVLKGTTSLEELARVLGVII